jgi:hypothetical protein
MPYLRAFDAYGVALKYGKEFDFIENYGVCQWGRGISAGTDAGLRAMLVMAGLGERWEEVRHEVYGESEAAKLAKWAARTGPSRETLAGRGLWGVPCVRYGDTMVFGQDKLWAIKAVLEGEHTLTAAGSGGETSSSSSSSTTTTTTIAAADAHAQEPDLLLDAIRKYCSH